MFDITQIKNHFLTTDSTKMAKGCIEKKVPYLIMLIKILKIKYLDQSIHN